MAKWIVDVSRIGYANREVTVEAGSAEAAENMALDMAGSLEFTEHTSEYETIGCVQVKEVE
jgi:hypothetical protein